MSYRNPVIPGFHPDPSICRVGDDFYLVTSSFEFFPGVPIFHSRDLVNWRPLGHCLTRTTQLDLVGVPSSGGIWAPTIRHHDGRLFMTTTVIEKGNFTNAPGDWQIEDWVVGRHLLVTAEDPAGEWSDPVWIEGGGIDPSLFFDDDGAVYFTHSDRGTIYQSTIDVESGARTSDVRAIWGGSGEKDTEGPHLYKVDGSYYLLTAEGGTSYGHMVTLGRSDSPWGPWTTCPWNPVVTHRNVNLPVQATGHADLVEAPDGTWWLVCLGVRPRGYPPVHVLGRETFLVPVSWEDGWLRVPRVDLRIDAATPGAQAARPARRRDAFTAAALDPSWSFLRGPCEGVHAGGGRLVLGPSDATLDGGGSPAFLAHRQEEQTCSAEIVVHLEAAAEGDEVGLTVFMNDRHHYAVAIRQVAGEPRIVERRRIGSLVSLELSAAAPAGPVRLRVDADGRSYAFSVAADGREQQAIFSAEAHYLSSEVAGGFTGVHVGPYFTGKGRAVVDMFEIENRL